MRISDFIPRGKENAIKRDDLSTALRLPDRMVRQLIEKARKDGALIMNDQNGEGYYISDDINDLKRQLRRNEHRARSILVQNTRLRKSIKELEERESGQLTMPLENN